MSRQQTADSRQTNSGRSMQVNQGVSNQLRVETQQQYNYHFHTPCNLIILENYESLAALPNRLEMVPPLIVRGKVARQYAV